MAKRGKVDDAQARGQRLSVALRENLKRRKAQARARAAGLQRNGDPGEMAGRTEFQAPDFRRNQGNE